MTVHPPLAVAISRSLGFPEALGRQLLMDFGLGSFVEKFEEFFGRWASGVLVGMVGLAVIFTCGSLIWTGFVQPVTHWAVEGPLKSPQTSYVLGALQVTLFTLLLGSSVLAVIWLRNIKRLWNDVTQFHDENRRIRQEYVSDSHGLSERIIEARNLTDDLKLQAVAMQNNFAELENARRKFDQHGVRSEETVAKSLDEPPLSQPNIAGETLP